MTTERPVPHVDGSGSTTIPTPCVGGGALARCVGDPGAFATGIWGRGPRLWKRDSADGFDDVFSIELADELLDHVQRRPAIRVVEGGENVAESAYTSVVRLGGRWVQVVDRGKIVERFAAGASIVFQSLHRTFPPVRSFVDDLTRDISHPIQANAYLTPAESTALAPHADQHDVIVLHLAGSKVWTVDGLGEFELGVGDRMYIPAGTRHSAYSTDSVSLHLTIGIIPTTYRSVVQRVLASIDGLDHPLPLDYRAGRAVEDSFAQGVADALSTATEALSEVVPCDVADRERRRRVGPAAVRTIAGIAALADIDATSRIAWNPSCEVLDPDDDDNDRRLRIVDGDRTIRIPATSRAALNLLVRGGRVRVAELPGLDEASRLVIARRLVAEQICETFHPASQET